MKIEQCLTYLKKNPRVGAEKSAKFYQQSVTNYKEQYEILRHLQGMNFFSFPDEDPDALLNCIDNVILNEAKDLLLQDE